MTSSSDSTAAHLRRLLESTTRPPAAASNTPAVKGPANGTDTAAPAPTAQDIAQQLNLIMATLVSGGSGGESAPSPEPDGRMEWHGTKSGRAAEPLAPADLPGEILPLIPDGLWRDVRQGLYVDLVDVHPRNLLAGDLEFVSMPSFHDWLFAFLIYAQMNSLVNAASSVACFHYLSVIAQLTTRAPWDVVNSVDIKTRKGIARRCDGCKAFLSLSYGSMVQQSAGLFAPYSNPPAPVSPLLGTTYASMQGQRMHGRDVNMSDGFAAAAASPSAVPSSAASSKDGYSQTERSQQTSTHEDEVEEEQAPMPHGWEHIPRTAYDDDVGPVGEAASNEVDQEENDAVEVEQEVDTVKVVVEEADDYPPVKQELETFAEVVEPVADAADPEPVDVKKEPSPTVAEPVATATIASNPKGEKAVVAPEKKAFNPYEAVADCDMWEEAPETSKKFKDGTNKVHLSPIRFNSPASRSPSESVSSGKQRKSPPLGRHAAGSRRSNSPDGRRPARHRRPYSPRASSPPPPRQPRSPPVSRNRATRARSPPPRVTRADSDRNRSPVDTRKRPREQDNERPTGHFVRGGVLNGKADDSDDVVVKVTSAALPQIAPTFSVKLGSPGKDTSVRSASPVRFVRTVSRPPSSTYPINASPAPPQQLMTIPADPINDPRPVTDTRTTTHVKMKITGIGAGISRHGPDSGPPPRKPIKDRLGFGQDTNSNYNKYGPTTSHNDLQSRLNAPLGSGPSRKK